ncbi:lipoyl(octanoyl) transferase LipB [Acidihalobacter prosperus]|uniref:Octanoyltransferase n=1 Tax=Acidihalobacter prosperus TaxID=160660 RepID=A0A1A6C6E3_9GAMM|nr:lipoyl(octanoyl) transferase LipB [Acidihalobacter prosperus]OBS10132.1 Octanoate-[acyl-carrier-protein]-protein-N-octan oyltransferase [Acidihalobacter prosperus]
MSPELRVHYMGRRDYTAVWQAMRDYTAARGADTADEFWIVEHPPVFTLGQAGRAEHVRDAGDIPVVQSDRGGQVTYHGPGQVVLYVLLDLRRLRLGVRALVENLEQTVVELLAAHGIAGESRREAPGVYVDGRKIAALGLRVRHGCSYHGLSLNVDLDPAPFARIDPCGYRGLEVARLADYGITLDLWTAGQALAERLARRLGYTAASGHSHHGIDRA